MMARARLKNSVTPMIMIDHRDQPPDRVLQRDVAEPGGGERRHGEIQRVGIILDVGIAGVLGLVNDPGGDEDEDREIDHRDENFLVAAEVGQVGAQLRQHVIGAQQPHRAQDAQEAGRFAGERREKRDDCGDVGPGRKPQQLAHRLWLITSRARKSARMIRPKATSNASSHGPRSMNEVPTMKINVKMSKISRP